MRHAIDSPTGRSLYSQRIATVEPVFAKLRHNKRLSRFTYRGLSKMGTQWQHREVGAQRLATVRAKARTLISPISRARSRSQATAVGATIIRNENPAAPAPVPPTNVRDASAMGYWTASLGRMRTRNVALGCLASAAVVSLGLLISGKRILVHERRVNPGELYVVPEHGNLGEAGQASLVCRYFTGRGIITTVFWYSSNNLLGKDQCPFVTEQ